ncbi:MAG: response regulator [FCB group bacterium]|nr:response regulator [FCB group bacterium]
MRNHPHILVVEDDLDTLVLYEKTIGRKYRIESAVSVPDAKRWLSKDDFDLVLLDLSLDGKEDGLDLTRFIRNDKKLKSLPVIAVTAHAFIQDMRNCLNAGCNEYIAKPYPIFELIKKVDHYIASSAMA